MRAELNPHVAITGTGAYMPEEVYDNDRLADMVSGYDAEQSGDFGTWVDQVTHVHERRFCAFETRSSDLALPAARQALEAAGIGPEDVGLIVYASCSLQPEEGPEVVALALAGGAPIERAPVAQAELHGLAVDITADGDVRTLPCHLAAQGGIDGFYIARLRRR